MEELRNILIELGLTSYKIETFFSLLKIKSGTIQQIAKNCNVPACKLYENLKWLHENGYITLVSQKPLSYRANNPKSIISDEIEKRKGNLRKLNDQLQHIKLNLPVAEKEIIQVTVTRDAYFKKIKESVRGVKKSILYTAKNWRVDAELIRLLEEKIKKGVIVKALGPLKENKEAIRWLKEIGVKVKNYNLEDTHFSVYDNSLVILSLRKDPKKSDYSAIWLKSETLAEVLTNYFNSIWKDKN